MPWPRARLQSAPGWAWGCQKRPPPTGHEYVRPWKWNFHLSMRTNAPTRLTGWSRADGRAVEEVRRPPPEGIPIKRRGERGRLLGRPGPCWQRCGPCWQRCASATTSCKRKLEPVGLVLAVKIKKPSAHVRPARPGLQTWSRPGPRGHERLHEEGNWQRFLWTVCVLRLLPGRAQLNLYPYLHTEAHQPYSAQEAGI